MAAVTHMLPCLMLLVLWLNLTPPEEKNIHPTRAARNGLSNAVKQTIKSTYEYKQMTNYITIHTFVFITEGLTNDVKSTLAKGLMSQKH